jgi:hypothetical protein
MTYADRTPAVVTRILDAESEQAVRESLGVAGGGTEKGAGRVTVRITRCARHLLDPDNCVASVKFLVDRLYESGLIPGDTEEDVEIIVSQIQTFTAKETGTSVRVIYP